MTHRVVFCFHTNEYEYHMGIGFMSSLLKRHGIDVQLVIYREISGQEVDTPEEVALRILNKEPIVVALSAMSVNWHRLKGIIPLLRKDFDGLILVGGYHAVLSPEEILSFPGVDVVCSGEGEEPLLALMKYYKGGPRFSRAIDGLIFAGESMSREYAKSRPLIERLEDYPYMDYSLFDSEGGKDLSHRCLGTLSAGGIFSLPVISGRGCPFKCTYCCNSTLIDMYGGVRKFVRRYSPESAVSHIKSVSERYRPQLLDFVDETFTKSRKWVKDFSALYKKEVGLPYAIMDRIDVVDEETISIMRDSGLVLVFIGIESGDEEYRNEYLNRRMTNKTIKEGVALFKKYGVIVVSFNMFGMPFETKDMIERTFILNEEIGTDIAVPFIYQPLQGTALANLAREKSFAQSAPEERWDFASSALHTTDLPASFVIESTGRFKEHFANKERVQNVYSRLRKLLT